MIAVAHQPTFLPWLGLMQKIARADVLVLLDDVQFARRDVQNRVQVKLAGGPAWLTVPVVSRGRFEQRIRDVELAENADAQRIIDTIYHGYRRAPHFDDLLPLTSILRQHLLPGRRLIDLNMALLGWLLTVFRLTPRLVFQSEIDWSGVKGDMILSVCQAVRADVYVSGAKAADEYMDDALFARNGVRVEVFRFRPREYPQLWGPFVPGLSAIDLLANVGVADAPRHLEDS